MTDKVMLTLADLGTLAFTADRNGTQGAFVSVAMQWAGEAQKEIERLSAALRKANDQAEHFERHWYLAKEDADRYAFAKTLEGQVVTAETFKNRGAAELDRALDDAMAEDADARNEAGYAA